MPSEDELLAHRARRERADVRALERQAANLAPRVTAGERMAMHILCDAARRGDITAADAKPFVTSRIAELDRTERRAA